MRVAGLISLAVATFVAWDFVLNYGFRAKWRTHAYGKITLSFKSTILIVLTLTIINGFFMHYPGRDVIRLVFFNAFVIAFVIQDIFLNIQLRKDKKVRENEQQDAMDSSSQQSHNGVS